MLKLIKPEIGQLEYRQKLIADSDTMAYNAKWGGTIDFPPEKWEKWYERCLNDANGKQFYRYVYSEKENCFVGEASYRYDEGYGEYIVNIIIEHKHRGKGYGREGLRLLMDAAKANGVEKLCDDIAADNPSVALFKEMGFSEEWRNDDAVMMAKTL